MSTAHRPTWNPAVGKEVKGGSRQFSTRDVASHTKLKFRQPGQGGAAEVDKRDLRAQLLKAEEEARAKKRKAGLLPPEPTMEDTPMAEIEDRSPDQIKRRKLLEDIAADRDDDDSDEDEEEGAKEKVDKGKGRATADDSDDEDDDDDDDEEDDEDEPAALMRELDKIKRERAEEQARKEREANAIDAERRDEEIATANPLMNLQAALGKGGSVAAGGSFAVKKRWDDDLIFKNQANGESDKPGGQFVNDLLRTEFHRKFMQKFIK